MSSMAFSPAIAERYPKRHQPMETNPRLPPKSKKTAHNNNPKNIGREQRV